MNKNRIRELRTEKGYSLAKMSEELNKKCNFKITPDAISKYERGLREPKIATWQVLANFFNVPISYIQGVSDVNDLNAFNDFEEFISKTGIENEKGDVAIPRKEAVAFSNEASYTAIELLRKASLNISDTSEADIKKYNNIINSISDKGVLDDIGLFVTTLYKLLLDAYNGDSRAKHYKEKIIPILSDYLGISDFKL